MKVAGSYTLSVPQARVYEVLQDPEVLSKCIPGCESLEKIGPDEYTMKMKMVLAAVSGSFTGKVKIRHPNGRTSISDVTLTRG